MDFHWEKVILAHRVSIMIIASVALEKWQDIVSRMRGRGISCTLWPGSKNRGRRRSQSPTVPFKNTSLLSRSSPVQPHPSQQGSTAPPPQHHSGDQAFITWALGRHHSHSRKALYMLAAKAENTLRAFPSLTRPVNYAFEDIKLCFRKVCFKHVLICKEKHPSSILSLRDME